MPQTVEELGNHHLLGLATLALLTFLENSRKLSPLLSHLKQHILVEWIFHCSGQAIGTRCLLAILNGARHQTSQHSNARETPHRPKSSMYGLITGRSLWNRKFHSIVPGLLQRPWGTAMGNPQVWLKYAVECERMAKNEGLEENRTALIQIARAWRKCAEEESTHNQELTGEM